MSDKKGIGRMVCECQIKGWVGMKEGKYNHYERVKSLYL